MIRACLKKSALPRSIITGAFWKGWGSVFAKFRRSLQFLVMAGAASWACAQPTWLTIIGAPDDPKVNTIQVDPVPKDGEENSRTMRVRVSRSAARVSWDGVAYRSYEADVLFDCRENTARYLSIAYFPQPHWRGEPRTVDYSTGERRMMEFREVVPNPHQRILYAACAGVTRK
jgi:hypothetical protein